MASTAEIERAIGAHGMWKTRLKSAIVSGMCDTPASTIRAENQCEFGKWLLGPDIPTAVKAAPSYREVRKLHAEFHVRAGEVAALVAAGRKAEASGMLELNGPFAKASAQLTSAMIAWKRDVAAF